MKCGREPGGVNAAELGTCPAAVDESFDGINSGHCGGRFCWAVAGTLCGGKVQGTFAQKRKSCLECGFYHRVQAEEGTANLRTKFLRFVSQDPQSPLLKGMRFQHIKAGRRFITQGEPADAAFIIQRGSCMVLVEKNGELHPVGHRGEGDIVGMMAILTGEPRSAHVEAETDMDVWVLDKACFDDLSRRDSELMSFLTELVADRFDSRRPIADRTIGKYVATHIIGRGGYSIVYKGFHTGLNMPVAIKMMRHDLVADPDYLVNFRNEAKIIAGLNHENIIRVFDVEERFKTVFIIMEYLQGESLRDLLLRLKTIPWKLAVDYLIQICAGLDCAHRQGIIHRDINTANIFVQPDDRVKIFDFGIACRAGTEDYLLGGAFPYMAPELFDGEPADERTDMYALGITAYEILAGLRPYPEESAGALMKLHRTRDIPDPAERITAIPDALRRFILKACRRDPTKRYQKVKTALEDLLPLAGAIGLRHNHSKSAARRTTKVVLSYNAENLEALHRLLEKFVNEAKELEIDLTPIDDPPFSEL
jgi:tRNA A-37 threonylcarbamoyl transferase component Bud32